MKFLKTTLALSLASALPALAQQAPDAGRVLRETQASPLLAPRPSTGIAIQKPVTEAVPAGGATVTLKALRISGNTRFTEKELLQVIGAVTGKSFDVAGLRAITEKITRHYHLNGYPFARAFLPAQNITDGTVTCQIVEGRYGRVQSKGEAALSERAQDFLAPLQPGAVITSGALERTTLILKDQPGIQTTSLIRPGQALGTGDLVVNVSRTPLFHGDVGADNYGNRYTGALRLRINAQFDSPFLFGDQITARGIYSEEDLWLGNLGYSLPLGSSGLRASVSYAHTYYELGEDFASLDAHGTAKVASAGVSYPLLRSQQTNLTLGATWQHKKLNDRQDSTSTNNDKSSHSAVFAMPFDHRDGLGGGGLTYGNLSYTLGWLKLDSTLDATDRSSHTDTRGDFSKWNLDLARLQALPADFNLLGRLSLQRANKNLDSSEDFSLGGPNGVRGYPVGEGIGDEGWLAQIELRYQWQRFAPYLFHDLGRVRINADPEPITPAVQDNTRSLAGSGFGLRYADTRWNVDVNLAWRHRGGEPTADTRDHRPRVWATASCTF
ncbi:MAG: ShlB/FhaC/HecB family hemolysin secretion/activation protein [Oxalobacter sp.]|nr:MAG: ShlB/FhaC/HecB family hemolysin secretion/activation protein [Oxalobacter sp.]